MGIARSQDKTIRVSIYLSIYLSICQPNACLPARLTDTYTYTYTYTYTRIASVSFLPFIRYPIPLSFLFRSIIVRASVSVGG